MNTFLQMISNESSVPTPSDSREISQNVNKNILNRIRPRESLQRRNNSIPESPLYSPFFCLFVQILHLQLFHSRWLMRVTFEKHITCIHFLCLRSTFLAELSLFVYLMIVVVGLLFFVWHGGFGVGVNGAK